MHMRARTHTHTHTQHTHTRACRSPCVFEAPGLAWRVRQRGPGAGVRRLGSRASLAPAQSKARGGLSPPTPPRHREKNECWTSKRGQILWAFPEHLLCTRRCPNHALWPSSLHLTALPTPVPGLKVTNEQPSELIKTEQVLKWVWSGKEVFKPQFCHVVAM